MKLHQIAIATLIFAFSDLAFSQSVEILSPRDGRAVNVDGFMVQVEIQGLQEMLEMAGWNHLYIQLGLMPSGMLEGEVYFGIACQASYSPNVHFWGRNVKLVHPDLYFKSHCAHEEDRLQISYRAEGFDEYMSSTGDTFDVHLRAWSTGVFYYDDWATVTIKE